jgi:hypothetical protein
MNPEEQFPLVMEAIRRKAGMGDSGAGVPGGAPVANSPAPSNPVAQQGMTPQQPAPTPEAPSGPFASSSATSALSQALPGEANLILKSLTKTLDRLTTPPKSPFGG